MQKWEYKIISQQQLKTVNAWAWTDPDAGESNLLSATERLNDLGKEGWELIHIRDSIQDGKPTIDFYLKKAIE